MLIFTYMYGLVNVYIFLLTVKPKKQKRDNLGS